jgi:hypothetical protein
VHCGKTVILFIDFEAALVLLTWLFVDFYMERRTSDHYEIRNTLKAIIAHFMHSMQLWRLRRGHENDASLVNLFDRLYRSPGMEATDPRDFVFALLSLLGEESTV